MVLVVVIYSILLNYSRVFSVFLFFSGCFFFITSLWLVGYGGFYINWGLFIVKGCEVGITVVLDWMSLIFLSFVVLISSGVMFYSEGYMLGDNDRDRFIFGVFLFVLSMVFVILSPNLISILLG